MCCNKKCCLIVGSVVGGLLAILGGVLFPEAVIEDGTIAYENWIVPGSPVYRYFWIFHVLNPDEVLKGGIPNLEQKGPYVYLVRHVPKSNVTQNNNNTVSFYQPNEAIFQPIMSIGPEEDTYTVLNLAVAYNGTSDGPYTVYNGKEDINTVALITKYKGESTLSYWKNDYCDMINGTDAASFPPFVDKNKLLYFFSSEICRSIYGEFRKEYMLKGIKLYRFVVPSSALASPTVNPDNYCYCTDTVLSRNCTAAGVLDLRVCQGGKPIFLSLPHFLHGSDFLLTQVNGLSPNEEEHQTFVDVEPITGFTMHFAKRLQVNTALIGKESADRFKSSVTVPMKVLEVVQILLLCLGGVLFFACSITLCVIRGKK
uniref:PAS-4 n=1 Tax=Pyxicephalus adspersus TaxID=30357 RepID=A0AAV3B323_PYXAD|nr:TPA: hypothetical protein GDO54_007215 [Pyxicephalus adspersus]